MSSKARMASNHLVLRRPHFLLKGDALYFLASARPARTLLPAEKRIWEAIEQPAALEALHKVHPEADSIVESFWQNELCEFLEPEFSFGRKRILVIEPHADDAALSISRVLSC